MSRSTNTDTDTTTRATRATRARAWAVDPDTFTDAWIDLYKNPAGQPTQELANRLGIAKTAVERMAFNLRRKGVQLPKLVRKFNSNSLMVDATALNDKIREELVD
jgi:biotin operon repressor